MLKKGPYALTRGSVGTRKKSRSPAGEIVLRHKGKENVACIYIVLVCKTEHALAGIWGDFSPLL